MSGNCTIRIADTQQESHFQVLNPWDGSGEDKGSFACGRQETNFEAKEVRLPRGLTCDACIVEVIWRTEKGK